MGQVSAKLRRATNSYFWFCPACEEMHPLPDGWTFDGNLNAPTFSPSFKHTDGRGWCCHYIVTAGKVAYCGDCTHGMAGKTIDMPDLPIGYRDGLGCIWSDGDKPAVDSDFAAKQIVDNLRAMQCDDAMAREILALCELKIKDGELRKPPAH